MNLVSGLPVVMLTTTGAKTGQQRVWPVLGLPDGDNLVVMASNWGNTIIPPGITTCAPIPRPRSPWAVPHGASGPMRPAATRRRLWRRGLEIYPGYAAYERRAANRRYPWWCWRR